MGGGLAGPPPGAAPHLGRQRHVPTSSIVLLPCPPLIFLQEVHGDGDGVALMVAPLLWRALTQRCERRWTGTVQARDKQAERGQMHQAQACAVHCDLPRRLAWRRINGLETEGLCSAAGPAFCAPFSPMNAEVGLPWKGGKGRGRPP